MVMPSGEKGQFAVGLAATHDTALQFLIPVTSVMSKTVHPSISDPFW